MAELSSVVHIQSIGAKNYFGNTFSIEIKPITIITDFLEPATPIAIHPLLLLKQSMETPNLSPGCLWLAGPIVHSSAKGSFSIEIGWGTAKYECTYDVCKTGEYALATSSYLRVNNTEIMVHRNDLNTLSGDLGSVVGYGPFLYWKTAYETNGSTNIPQSILQQAKSVIYVPEREGIHLDSPWDIGEIKEPCNFPGSFNNHVYRLLYTWIKQDDRRVQEVETSMSKILGDTVDLHENWRRYGDGFHSLLPIVVAATVSQPYQIVCIEYPEMHLHPFTQKRLLLFLTQITQNGTIFVLTTHSETILSQAKSTVSEDCLSVVEWLAGQRMP